MPLLAKNPIEKLSAKKPVPSESVNPQRTRLDYVNNDDKPSGNVEVKSLIMTPYRYNGDKLLKKKEL